MNVLTDKVPPLPTLAPPLTSITPPEIDLSKLRFDNTWVQWFTQVKYKIDTINTNLVGVSQIAGQGIIVRSPAGTWEQISIVGTLNRIAVANGDGTAGNPTIDIDSAYIGQASITTLGTIVTGNWNGSVISNVYLDAAPKMTVTSTSATGGSATALPAQPVGYVEIKVGSNTKKIAYYDP